MRKQPDDLTGKKFGRLTALYLAEPDITSGGIRMTRWMCQCECGRMRVARATYLKRGAITHCGFCTPPKRREAKMRICRFCEYSEWQEKLGEWICGQGRDPTQVTKECSGYYCGAYDKVSGVKNRESKCFVCGTPIYSHGSDTPIYCKDHRAYAEQDEQALNDIPHELLFSLVAGIFLRARDDYLFDADGQRGDAEEFLKSEWAQNLSVNGFDVDKVFEVMDGLRGTDEDIE